MGLVLTGGGARAAYQAGVIQGVSDIFQANRFDCGQAPFQALSGVSAGAINSMFLAGTDESFETAACRLVGLWENITVNQVFRTDMKTVSRIGSRWLRDLTFGGLIGSTRSTHLLDTTPLRDFLHRFTDFPRLYQRIEAGRIQGVALSATNYRTGTAITFYDGSPKIQPWARSARLGIRQKLTVDHILASSAIPGFFPPVRLGQTFYGDGGLRLSTPCSPVIHMGADRVFAVGIRHFRSEDTTERINRDLSMEHISIAHVGEVVLNSIFADSLDSDIERLERINQTLDLMPEEIRAKHPRQLRKIPILAMRPSKDLGTLASEQFQELPRFFRYMLRGLGVSEREGWDLISYLAFMPSYTKTLIRLGREDAQSREKEILKFFTDASSA
ncbi:MAG: patatin-like phospholipase family protein [Bdellovibrionales bacterium]|nr:patatin-like phospholipase family protein [Bdellovibrionales bacterium]